jgi:hypothetical protein
VTLFYRDVGPLGSKRNEAMTVGSVIASLHRLEKNRLCACGENQPPVSLGSGRVRSYRIAGLAERKPLTFSQSNRGKVLSRLARIAT